MSPEELFIHSLDDLYSSINSRNDYEVLQASKILRQLLLDGDRLVIAVNHKYRLRIEFHVLVPSPPPEFVRNEATWIVIESLNPRGSKRPPELLPLEKFLALEIGGSRGETITIKDVIKFAAIKLGGVHFKEASSPEDQKFIDLINKYFFLTEQPLYTALRVIGRIVLDSLLTLRNEILDRKSFENSNGFTCLLSLCIFPGEPDEDTFIFDYGTDENQNRLSVYVDSRRELTLRIINSAGTRRYVRAGEMGKAIPYGVPQIFLCELARRDDRILLSIQTDTWDHVEILNPSVFDPKFGHMHFVVGSDCIGKKKTHMLFMGQLVIDRILTENEKSKTINYYQQNRGADLKGLMFKGNQFLHSKAHPNFEKS